MKPKRRESKRIKPKRMKPKRRKSKRMKPKRRKSKRMKKIRKSKLSGGAVSGRCTPPPLRGSVASVGLQS